jgi:hypothetical protein
VSAICLPATPNQEKRSTRRYPSTTSASMLLGRFGFSALVDPHLANCSEIWGTQTSWHRLQPNLVRYRYRVYCVHIHDQIASCSADGTGTWIEAPDPDGIYKSPTLV